MARPHSIKADNQKRIEAERYDTYHLQLGRFIHAFSQVEAAMQFVLRFYAKTAKDIGRAIFSGVRIETAMGHINRIMEVQPPSEDARQELADIFQQLHHINNVRNAVVHYGAEGIAEGKPLATNALMALTEDRIQNFAVGEVTLHDMRTDLRKIIILLHAKHVGRPPLKGKEAEIDAVARQPWRYTPPQQRQSRGKKGRVPTPALSLRPEPFRE